jgi:multiple sugar transport system substrate-binding protein
MTIDQYADIAMQLAVPSDDMATRIWGGAAPGAWWMDVQNYYSPDGRSVEGYINDAATAHFFDVLQELYDSGAVLTSAETSLVSADDLIATGQLAMTVGDSVILQPLLEANDIRWGAAPPPVEEAGQDPWVYTGSDELMAFAGGDHPEEAIEFVLFWGTEGNRLRFEREGALPLSMTLAEELDWAGQSEGRQEMLAAIQTARPTVFVPEWYFVFDHLDEVFNGFMLEDGMSAQEALDEIAPIVQDELDQRWETWESVQPN